MRTLSTVLLAVASITLVAQDEKPGELNVSIGYMFEGEMYVADLDEYYSVGETVLIRAEYDYYFATFNNRFGLGAYYTLGFPWYSSWYEEVTMNEFGLVLKARLPAGDNLYVKPGIYAGYRAYSGGINYIPTPPGDGLGVNASISLQFKSSGKVKPFVDLGFLTQPAGGNDDTDVTYGVTMQINVGVTL